MAVYNKSGNILSQVYDKSGNALVQAYDKSGNPIMETHAVSNVYTRSLIFKITDTSISGGTQGIACDSLSQKIAQLYTGKIYMFNQNGSYTQVASVFNLGHGGTGQFAPTKEAGQDYPLLYVSAQKPTTVDNVVYAFLLEVQCSTSSSTMPRAFAVSETEGYAGIFAIDFDNSIAYHIYKEAYESDTVQIMYISAWDMTEYELAPDLSWTPASAVYRFTNKLKSFSVPFVNEMQACTFFDGLIACLSDDGYVRFIDPVTESVYLTINQDMPAFEREGIDFMLNPTTGKYDMILSNRTTTEMNVYRYEFET